VVADAIENRQRMRTRKRHDTAVAQPDRFFAHARVGFFADGDKLVALDDKPSIAGRIARPKTEHNHGRAGRQWSAQFVQGLGANKRRVATNDENVVGPSFERRARGEYGMRGSTPLALHEALRARQRLLGLGGDGFLIGPDHDRAVQGSLRRGVPKISLALTRELKRAQEICFWFPRIRLRNRAISPATRLASASHQLSFVVSIAVMVLLIERTALSNWRPPHVTGAPQTYYRTPGGSDRIALA